MKEAVLLAAHHLVALAAFLDRHADTTLFLRSNLAEAGLHAALHPFGGVWAGAFDGESLIAVSAHFNGGNVVVGGEHAGSLLHASGRGAHRSVLFTRGQNRPARRAYETLGYREVGDYGLLLF